MLSMFLICRRFLVVVVGGVVELHAVLGVGGVAVLMPIILVVVVVVVVVVLLLLQVLVLVLRTNNTLRDNTIRQMMGRRDKL